MPRRLNYNGAASVKVDVDDLGHNGTGGSMTDSKTVNLNVGAIERCTDHHEVPAHVRGERGQPLAISGMAIVINDVDAGAADVQITLGVSHGTLTRDPAHPGRLRQSRATAPAA